MTYKFSSILAIILISLLSGCEKEIKVEPQSYNCTNNFQTQSNTHPKRDKYQAFINEHWVKRGLPGAILLIRDQHGLWIGAGGKIDLANNVDMKPCNQFRIASITKALNAAAIMRLHEKGVLNIDNKAIKYLPEFSEVPHGNEITIRQLLSHTSGLGGEDFIQGTLNYFNGIKGTFPTFDEQVKTFKKGALFQPGTNWSYSRGHDIAGVVVERVTGKRPYQIIKEEVVNPLRMTSTILDDNYNGAGLSKKYMDFQANGKVIELKMDGSAGTSTKPGSLDFVSGGGISTAHDLMIFIEALSKGELLQPATFNDMLKAVNIPKGLEGWEYFSRYGVGVAFLETPYGTAVGHEGDDFGASSFMFHFPDKDVTIVGFMNVTSSPFRDIFRDYNALTRVIFK